MINQCNFIGRLGRDPEAKETTSGKMCARFSLACSETWIGADGEKHEETEWVNCIAWGRLGEICCQYLKKGSLAYVTGKMKTRPWEGQDGAKRSTTEIILREMKILSSKGTASPADEGVDGGLDVPF